MHAPTSSTADVQLKKQSPQQQSKSHSPLSTLAKLAAIALIGGVAGAIVALAIVYGGDFDNNGSSSDSTQVLQQADDIACTSGEASGLDWTYNLACTKESGLVQPAQWSANYPTCGGNRQSPVNVARPDVADTCAQPLGAFNFVSGTCPFGGLGYTASNKNWEVDFDPEACDGNSPYFTLGAGGDKYVLSQYHLHSVSEHVIGGGHSDAELHLVHINENNAEDIIVVGVMINANSDLRGNTELSKYWSRLAAAAAENNGTEQPAADPHAAAAQDSELADPYALLPPTDEYYTYLGSLTTPPCSEIVTWVLMADPIEVAPADLKVFRDGMANAPGTVVDASGSNARPVQPLNGRTVSRCTM